MLDTIEVSGSGAGSTVLGAGLSQESSAAGLDSTLSGFAVSQASSTGTEGFSLIREPFVCAADAPRPPLAPPRPRSDPRPRLPRLLSKAPRPPRELRVLAKSVRGEVLVPSLAFDFDLSFLFFETSPHCVMVPISDVSSCLKYQKS